MLFQQIFSDTSHVNIMHGSLLCKRKIDTQYTFFFHKYIGSKNFVYNVFQGKKVQSHQRQDINKRKISRNNYITIY